MCRLVMQAASFMRTSVMGGAISSHGARASAKAMFGFGAKAFPVKAIDCSIVFTPAVRMELKTKVLSRAYSPAHPSRVMNVPNEVRCLVAW